jgi:hypothetical protein
LEYDGLDCRGVPTKVSNLQAITHVSQDFGECVNGIRWNYLSDYPVMQDLGAGYGATYSNIDVCDPTVRNYYGYDFRRGDFCSKVARQNNVYAKSNVQGCEGEGMILLPLHLSDPSLCLSLPPSLSHSTRGINHFGLFL